MGCIIVMMPRSEDSIRIKRIIQQNDIAEDVIISSRGSETLEIAGDREVSIVICTKRAADMGYEELSSYLPQSVTLLLLTKDPALMPFCSNVVKLLLPLGSDNLINSIRMLLPATYEIKRKKDRPPARSPKEQKVIDEAKLVLMNRNGMTEPEAFRYIQKTSMDASRSMSETAQMILLMQD